MPPPLQDFALFVEGVTDQAVLTNVLHGFFKDQREPSITEFHPVYSETEKYGGWQFLLKHLEERRYRDAFQFNQYVIVEVDTDTADGTGFDVARHDETGPLSLEAFVVKVIERLKAAIGEADLRSYDGRFLFAVAVEQIECWMLPLWFDDDRATAEDGCFIRLGRSAKLQDELRKKKEPYFKDYNLYLKLSKEYRKPKILRDKGPRNSSLKMFLEALEARQIVLPPVD